MKQFLVRACSVCLFLSFVVMVQAQDTKEVAKAADTDAPNVIDGAVQPSVTKSFITSYDVAVIDIKEGKIDYQCYVNTKDAPDQWSLVDSKSVDEPKIISTSDVTIRQTGSYQMRLVLSTACDNCASVKFLPR